MSPNDAAVLEALADVDELDLVSVLDSEFGIGRPSGLRWELAFVRHHEAGRRPRRGARCPCRECAAPSARRQPLYSASTNAYPVAESLMSSIGGRFAVALLALHGRSLPVSLRAAKDRRAAERPATCLRAIGVLPEVVGEQTGSRVDEQGDINRIDGVCRRRKVAKAFFRSHAGRLRGFSACSIWASSRLPVISPSGATPTSPARCKILLPFDD